jgi:hypothetical protein
MKIAICISGMPRTFVQSHDSFKINILDDITNHNSTYDIIISTWDKKTQFGSGREIAQNNDGSLDDYKSLYSPLIFDYEEYDINTIKLLYEKYKIPKNIKLNHAMMLYKIYRCNTLINTKYDLVFRTRSDLLYKNKIYHEMISSINENKLFLRRDGGNSPEIDGICIWDQIAFGPPALVTDFCNTFENVEDTIKISKDLSPEGIIYTHLQHTKTPIGRSYIEYDFIRDDGIQRIMQ